MGIEESILALFKQLIAQHGGNKAAAAASIGVNSVTFWGWVKSKRGLNRALCQASDRAGGILLIPGDSVPASREIKLQTSSHPQGSSSEQVAALEARIRELEAQVRALEVYKHKWEGHLEAEAVRAQGSGFASMPVEKKRSA